MTYTSLTDRDYPVLLHRSWLVSKAPLQPRQLHQSRHHLLRPQSLPVGLPMRMYMLKTWITQDPASQNERGLELILLRPCLAPASQLCAGMPLPGQPKAPYYGLHGKDLQASWQAQQQILPCLLVAIG